MGRLHTSGSIIKKKRDASSTQKTTKQKSKILPRNVNNNKQKNLPKRIQFDSDLLDIFPRRFKSPIKKSSFLSITPCVA